MSPFDFLEREWPTVHEAAGKAAAAVYADPRTACFYARRALELAVAWAYKHDAALNLPYQDNLSALIHEPSFKITAGEAVFNKAKVITTLGNRAVHSHRAIPPTMPSLRSGNCSMWRTGSPAPTAARHDRRPGLSSTRARCRRRHRCAGRPPSSCSSSKRD
ncbi:type III restriction protein res subunit [mine drainage metagenome]|uniref:Type III restriction protein res subunit n=2 Tax=mine drainage metagenome TaxID=410659 RepID=T0YL29_9ZZZZ